MMKSCLFLLMFVSLSCSTVSVTRTPNGGIHAGITSLVGKQGVRKATITTREGDVITVDGYSTQNPDPETTKMIRDGFLINKAIEVGGDVIDTGIKEGAALLD